MGAKHASLAERLWRRVEKTDGCWLWTGSVNTRGYGHIRDEAGRLQMTHRVAYALTTGQWLAPYVFLCHRCDTPRCVRPDHLFVGDHTSNAADMVAKGRSATGDQSSARLHPERRPRGARNHGKLTAAQVRAIRANAVTRAMSTRALARHLGVGHSTLQAVIHGRTWSHIE